VIESKHNLPIRTTSREEYSRVVVLLICTGFLELGFVVALYLRQRAAPDREPNGGPKLSSSRWPISKLPPHVKWTSIILKAPSLCHCHPTLFSLPCPRFQFVTGTKNNELRHIYETTNYGFLDLYHLMFNNRSLGYFSLC
jgi:hypothetical protein